MKNHKLEVKLIKSLIGSNDRQRSSANGLGLSKLGEVVLVLDTPENIGMINKVKHLLEVKHSKKED